MAQEFPDDPNGDVLRRLRGSGDSLTSPRDIYFSVIFPDAGAATAFCRQLHELGYEAKLEETSGSDRYSNDVTATVNMVPTHADICAFEDKLDELASPLGGENDGWFCEALQSKH